MIIFSLYSRPENNNTVLADLDGADHGWWYKLIFHDCFLSYPFNIYNIESLGFIPFTILIYSKYAFYTSLIENISYNNSFNLGNSSKLRPVINNVDKSAVAL